MKNFYSHFLVTILCLFFSNFLYSQFEINNNSEFDEKSLHTFTKIINLKQENLSINDILKISDKKFKNLTSENTDLGFTNDNYWLKFSVKNNSIQKQKYFIETSRPIVDYAAFYKVSNNYVVEIQKSGDHIPFNQKSVNHRKTIFKLNLNPSEFSEYYIHLKSDGEVINAPILIRTTENLIDNTAFEQIVFGFFYGILLITSILYFFFHYAMKEKVFLFYSLYVVLIGLLQFSLDGYFHQYVLPNAGWFSDKSVLIFAIFSAIFLGNYAQDFLHVKKVNKNLDYAFNALYILLSILFLIIVFLPFYFQYCYPAMNVFGLFLLILIVSSMVQIYVKLKQFYLFFTLGIFFLILGFVVFILKNFSILPYNFITENSSKLGTGVEVIFLSLSMASLIKKLKEDRESSQELALQKSEEMNELKSYFLSNISHELRTPLNTIMNLIELINGETDSNAIQKKCEIIKYSSQSLLSSVNDILDFSKIEKDEIVLEELEYDAHKLFEEIKNNFAQRAKEQEIDFQFSQAINVPKIIKGDCSRVHQILTNILNNAFKFTTDGIIKFKIECKEIDSDSVALNFIISDTGIGIPKSKINSIFDSFSQYSINNKRKYGGLGLGLYIVKALVDLHKGKIEMDSIVNQGTVCKVSFSVIKVKEQEIIEVVSEVNYDLKGKHILVVEDNAMNQMVIKMITKKWLNTTLDYAINGQEALNLMTTNRYDLILMDLQMPIMDGYEATIAIRNGNCGINDRNIPIIAVTADVMETTKNRVKEIGMNLYLSKPINKELLYNSIKELILK
ncbi:7TM diverse intracellular signaling domain-containing protein [Flavobacterium sp.]|uniref:hybrid sensor histidine kinase/response regulator n=1 Tax=Flavobacterium sp. TaxID=239 RepID=UPI0037512F74